MQKLRDYLTKEGWKKDLEETLTEDRPLSMYNTTKDLKDGVITSVMTPISFCVVAPACWAAVGCMLTYWAVREAYRNKYTEKNK